MTAALALGIMVSIAVVYAVTRHSLLWAMIVVACLLVYVA